MVTLSGGIFDKANAGSAVAACILGYLRFGSLWGDTSFMLVLLEVRSWSWNYSTLVSVKDELSSFLGGELLN